LTRTKCLALLLLLLLLLPLLRIACWAYGGEQQEGLELALASLLLQLSDRLLLLL
jgi:hypothetical protein